MLRAHGREVLPIDIYAYEGRPADTVIADYLNALQLDTSGYEGAITNPPYRHALAFAEKLLREHRYVGLLLRSNFYVEAAERDAFFEAHPPTRVWFASLRLPMMHRYGWTGPRQASNTAHCWLVWDNGAPREFPQRFDYRRVLDGEQPKARSSDAKPSICKTEITASPAPDNPAAKWIALRQAIAEAKERGAEFCIIGDAVEISGELPAELRARLPGELLWSYLGAERTDFEAQQFADLIGIVPVPVSDPSGLAGIFEALTGADYIGLDIETGVPGRKPLPVALTKDGGIAAVQPRPDDDGLDARRSAIATLQLCGDGERVFVVTGAALKE